MSHLRPRIQAKLDGMAARAAELMAQSADPQLLARPERLATIQKDLGQLGRITAPYEQYRRLQQQIADNEALVAGGDQEMAALAAAELPELQAGAGALAEQLLELLLSDQGDDRRDCIIEVRAGTGGEEAALFASDLAGLYQRYAARMGWTVEVMHSSPAEQGGFKEVIFAVRGASVFHFLQFESGGHRVQRVPATEAKGRVHTSAATVAVLPEVEDVEVQIDDKDLKIDTYRSSGAGGQHVNKTESAVRITHVPTGTVVACQEERSQHKNRARAMKLLRSRIYEQRQRARDAARASDRKEQVGSGDRSERIRTYNFPQDRLTDHRIHRNFSLAQVMEGRLEPVVQALLDYDRQRRIEEL
ncbi:MAG TPA: peptide chain release factor 1 [Planctomycetota bacterium]|nr:peptide chain release factor 1 [Planctomycetota bacterium]